MPLLRRILIAATVVGLATTLLVGCGKADDGLSDKDRDKATRAQEIVKKSGGNWDSVSADDKAYLVKEIGYGNEYNAKMFFMAESGKLRNGAGPGGPAGGGPPKK